MNFTQRLFYKYILGESREMVIRHRIIKLIILALIAFVIMPVVTSFAGTIGYTYDELNRLKTETYPDETIIEYFYDRLGNRTSRTVTVPFYVITASAGDGGSITPSGNVSVRKWSNQAFQIVPDVANGYKIADVLVDNVSQGPVSSYTFENVTTTHSIHASFDLKSYDLNVSVNTTGSGSGGTVSGSDINCPGTCAAQYVHGTSVTLTAAANAGYRFTGWAGDCTVNTDGTCTVLMTNAKYVTAGFMQTLTITASAGGHGQITPSGTLTYDYGSNQTFSIVANAADGFHIAAVLVDSVPLQDIVPANTLINYSYPFVDITASHTIEAQFAINTYQLSANVQTNPLSGTGGKIVSSPAGLDCGVTCTATYTHGTPVTLTAPANAGYRFTGWAGDCSGTGTCTVAMYGNKSVTANFIQTFTLTSYAGDNGSLSPSGKSTVDYGGSIAYTLTAVPGANIVDVIIDGVATGSTAAAYQFTNVTSDHTIAGVFSCSTLQEPVMIPRTQAKYYSSLQEAYADAADGETIQARTVYMSGNFTFSKNISLAGGYSCGFAGTTDVPTPLQGSVTIQQPGAVTMKNFALQSQLPEGAHQLNVSIGGDTASGTVTSSLNDMSCGASCTGVYYKGTNITLTAEPKACYNFVGWSGCTNIGGTNGNQCTVSVDAAKNVTANFRIKTFTLTSYAGANGSMTPGAVVNCGSNATFAITPDVGATIADVLVDGVSQGVISQYAFSNVTAPHSITAVFACDAQRLPVRIASAPNVFYSSLQEAYDHASADDVIHVRDVYLSGALDLTTSGKNITLEGGYNCDYTVQTGRPTPFKGAVKVSGGTANMKNFELLAQLPENQYLMDVVLTGDSSGGTVTSSLNDMNCSSTECKNAYYSGTMVTLTATPKECHDFTGWTGCTNVNGNQCMVTIDQAKNVTANFTIRKYLITIDAGHSGIITPLTGYVNCGSNPTYTVTADSGALIGTNNVEVDGTPVGPASSSTTFNFTLQDVRTAHLISATYLCPSPLVRIEGSGDYGSIQEAYNAAPEGAVIKTQDYILDYRGTPLTFNNNKIVTLKGGYYCDFTTNSGRTTHIRGSINIGAGKVEMENIVLDK